MMMRLWQVRNTTPKPLSLSHLAVLGTQPACQSQCLKAPACERPHWKQPYLLIEWMDVHWHLCSAVWSLCLLPCSMPSPPKILHTLWQGTSYVGLKILKPRTFFLIFIRWVFALILKFWGPEFGTTARSPKFVLTAPFTVFPFPQDIQLGF